MMGVLTAAADVVGAISAVKIPRADHAVGRLGSLSSGAAARMRLGRAKAVSRQARMIIAAPPNVHTVGTSAKKT
jgi:hypothetical protein